jgi:UDP-N-acetylmuramoyl-L-alanine---L-glutamate ligase
VRFSELDGATVGVWGAGREIRSFVSQLARRLPTARIPVVAFDARPEPGALEALNLPQARVAVGADAVAALSPCDIVVRSPGVSVHRPELRELRERGTPVTTATALWLAERGGEGVIGITGTKGKSTTAALAHHLAQAVGADSALAGNIGAPALDLLDRDPPELVLLELSSYQIADLETGPEVTVVTSLFPEHVDWHGSDATYKADKLRLLALPGVRTAVVNARFPALTEAAREVERVVPYGAPNGWDVGEAGVSAGGELAVPSAALPLPGEHNALNLCAALAALGAVGIEPALPADLRGFEALPHRLEAIGERDGILWVDDSISTTPESTLAALEAFAGRDVVLLAGGQDRGQDYVGLGRALAKRGTSVVGMPTTGARIVTAARDAGAPEAGAIAADDLDSAVRQARALAAPGGVILLSPAAPSYDRFRDFEERGDLFRSLAG